MSLLKRLFMGNLEALEFARQKCLSIMAEQDKKDKALAELEPFIDPIVERALKTREEYLEAGNESGIFELNETEMNYIKKQIEILFGRKDSPVTYFLGMKIVEAK